MIIAFKITMLGCMPLKTLKAWSQRECSDARGHVKADGSMLPAGYAPAELDGKAYAAAL